MTYAEQLKHPKWQRRRLEIMSRAEFTCEHCGESEKTLHVHHKIYRDGLMAWEYAESDLICLCEDCHKERHEPCSSGLLEMLLAQLSSEEERRELIARTFALWHELLLAANERRETDVAAMLDRDRKAFRASPNYEEEMRRRRAMAERIRSCGSNA